MPFAHIFRGLQKAYDAVKSIAKGTALGVGQSLARLYYTGSRDRLAAARDAGVSISPPRDIVMEAQSDGLVNLGQEEGAPVLTLTEEKAFNGKLQEYFYLVNHGETTTPVFSGHEVTGWHYAQLRPYIKQLALKHLRDNLEDNAAPPACWMNIKITIGGNKMLLHDPVQFNRSNTESERQAMLESQMQSMDDKLVENAEKYEETDDFIADFIVSIGQIARRAQRGAEFLEDEEGAGGSFIPMPPSLRNRRGLINVENTDNGECFEYSVIVSLYHKSSYAPMNHVPACKYAKTKPKTWSHLLGRMLLGWYDFPHPT